MAAGVALIGNGGSGGSGATLGSTGVGGPRALVVGQNGRNRLAWPGEQRAALGIWERRDQVGCIATRRATGQQ
ncbi:hypothetical protein [Mycobacterium spongiae]|uniref:Uncharacterized protein n=1 Tax=Mycobacterium spongiae TaxID=886343 RepID=A0A975PYL1_9MYCO|nr:hypothetical protein [Mycobacterium spongiae]QUR69252.1 hypothetical protein F6B93_21190 [Mycobacterium spongiae]